MTSIPTYHRPDIHVPLPIDGVYWAVPVVMIVAGVTAIVIALVAATDMDVHGLGTQAASGESALQTRVRRGYRIASGFSFGLGAVAVTALIIFLAQINAGADAANAAQGRLDHARKSSVTQYHDDLKRWFADRYGVTVSVNAALDLMDGDEAAGTLNGDTVTLHLLNRDDPRPILVGTDHNPLPVLDGAR